MADYVENIIFENQEVTVGGFPGIELVEEYFNPMKPNYQWNSEDNLLVCLKFSECLPFPEMLFQRFIVERQGDAFWVEEEIEVEKNVDLDPEIDEEDLLQTFHNDDRTRSYTTEKKIFSKRCIWSNGLFMQQSDENNQFFQIDVEKREDEKQVIVRCSGKSIEAKKAFDTVFGWFKNQPIQLSVLAVCTCVLCKKNGFQTSHQIQYEHLENLKKRYEPKIQCYGSGLMLRLDDISTIKRPSYKTTIINAPSDDVFCEKAKNHFFPPQSLLETKPFDRKQVAGTNSDQEYERNISYSDVIIALISANLTGGETEGDKLARKMVEIAEKEFSEGKLLLMFIIVRNPSTGWEDCSPFDNSEIPILNHLPISDSVETDAWKQIGKTVHDKIKKWLQSKSEINK